MLMLEPACNEASKICSPAINKISGSGEHFGIFFTIITGVQ